MTTAKGVTNGAVPMGAVFASRGIHDAFMHGPGNGIEFFHGYTYSGHPVACAAALATLDIYAEEGLLARARRSPRSSRTACTRSALPHVIDIRNLGLMGAIDFAPRPGAPGRARLEVFGRCWEPRPAAAPDRRHPRLLPAADRREEASGRNVRRSGRRRAQNWLDQG